MKKQELEQLVATSQSLSEVLRKQGKSVSGDAVAVLRNTLDSLDISYAHLNYNYAQVRPKRSLEEILQRDVYIQASKLKQKLINVGLKEDKCECCGCTNVWNGKPLTLELHHIDGDHMNNTFENLQVICPNCHSQFSHKKAKDSKKPNYCPDCGKEISRGASYCFECFNKHKKEYNFGKCPSKEKLLELLKKFSPKEIGKQLGVSDTSVRKWCKKLGIPSTKKELREYLFS